MNVKLTWLGVSGHIYLHDVTETTFNPSDQIEIDAASARLWNSFSCCLLENYLIFYICTFLLLTVFVFLTVLLKVPKKNSRSMWSPAFAVFGFRHLGSGFKAPSSKRSMTLTQARQNAQGLCEKRKVTCVSVAAFNIFHNPHRSRISWFLILSIENPDFHTVLHTKRNTLKGRIIRYGCLPVQGSNRPNTWQQLILQ